MVTIGVCVFGADSFGCLHFFILSTKETKEEMDKRETLQKLYTLRGGFSVLAVMRDEVRASQIRINNNLKAIEAKKAAQNQSKINADAKRKHVVEEINSVKGQENKNQEDLKEGKCFLGLGIFMAISGILLLYLHMRCYYWFQGHSGFDKFLAGAVFYCLSSLCTFYAIIGAPMGVIMTIVGLAWILGGKKQVRYSATKVHNLEEQQNNKNSIINQAYQNEIAAYNADIRNIERAISQEKENQKAVIIQFKAAYTTMKKMFASFIDERDWRNLDYIIFCFETGRALDMRDALLQVDKENRAERLEKAINGAVKEINQSIRNATVSMQKSMQELGGLITEQTRTMLQIAKDAAEQSARQHAAMMGAMNSNHSDTINALNKGLNGLSNQNKVQTALLAKINVSSAAMANDISSIKNYGVQCYI